MSPEERISALLEENDRLRAEAAGLRAENEQLREELEALLEQAAGSVQGKRERSVKVKPNRQKSDEARGPRRKRAAEHNRSRKRMEPTRVERHALERCPECAYRLSGESIDYTRQVVELPEPQPVEVIEHQVIKRWCPRCGAWHSPKLELGGQVLGQGRIGVRAVSLVAYLRTTLRIPVRGVQEYLRTLHGLRVSVGEIVGLMHGARRALQGRMDELRAAVRASPVVHCDETGWREDGQNGYVWACVTEGEEAVRYFEYNRSRGQLVPQHILGLTFRGWLVSDFYSAYNLLRGRHQRCWVHLLGDLHTLKEEHAGQMDVARWALQVREVYDGAQAWLREQPEATAEERQAAYSCAYQRICALGQQYAQADGHACRVLARRLLRFQEELFQFVLVPGLPADNNPAERSLRPVVIMRKISGGTRSPAGSRTRLTLASVFATWVARHLNPFRECLAALQRPTANGPPRTLSPQL
jgi:transposase